MAETPSTTDNTPQPVTHKRSRTKLLASIALFFIITGLGIILYYFSYLQFHETTDDAYINGNLVYVTSQVEGTISRIDADDNQPVKTGQTLIELDSADSAVALEDAKAHLAETVRELRQQYRHADEAVAVVAQKKAELERAKGDLKRRQLLSGSEALSKEDLAHAKAAVTTAQDALTIATHQLASARATINGVALKEHPTLLRARATFERAYLAFERNTILSPVNGIIARRSVQIGQRVSPGKSLLAVIPLQGVWIDANFKESQLAHVRIGQPAVVTTDLYGSHISYRGKVIGISAGTGGAFSLLPPQNATGNWIKVVQRLPVKVALDPRDLEKHPLRIGLSAIVDVDTHDRSGSVLSALTMPDSSLDTPVFNGLLQAAQAKADQIIEHETGH